MNQLFYNYKTWSKFGFTIFRNDINEYISNINCEISIVTGLNSNPINGIFLGIGNEGGMKIKTNNNVLELVVVNSFYFPKVK